MTNGGSEGVLVQHWFASLWDEFQVYSFLYISLPLPLLKSTGESADGESEGFLGRPTFWKTQGKTHLKVTRSHYSSFARKGFLVCLCCLAVLTVLWEVDDRKPHVLPSLSYNTGRPAPYSKSYDVSTSRACCWLRGWFCPCPDCYSWIHTRNLSLSAVGRPSIIH